MSKPELRAAIDRLQRELDALSNLDHASRQRLLALIELMRGAADDEAATTSHEGGIEAIRDAIDEFEVTHPRTTAILNDILVMLGNMGI